MKLKHLSRLLSLLFSIKDGEQLLAASGPKKHETHVESVTNFS